MFGESTDDELLSADLFSCASYFDRMKRFHSNEFVLLDFCRVESNEMNVQVLKSSMKFYFPFT